MSQVVKNKTQVDGKNPKIKTTHQINTNKIGEATYRDLNQGPPTHWRKSYPQVNQAIYIIRYIS